LVRSSNDRFTFAAIDADVQSKKGPMNWPFEFQIELKVGQRLKQACAAVVKAHQSPRQGTTGWLRHPGPIEIRHPDTPIDLDSAT
jgi:hypothetical protein